MFALTVAVSAPARSDMGNHIAGPSAAPPASLRPHQGPYGALSTPTGIALGSGEDDSEITAEKQPMAPWIGPLMDRQLGLDERTAPLAPELDNAILRIEGIYDPTRIGIFGPALRMQIRAGTASMNNVFGDRWTRADKDPNIHFNVGYIAYSWLQTKRPNCGYLKYSADDASLVFRGVLSAAECTRALRPRTLDSEPEITTPVISVPLSLPAFAAPYPGSRLSHRDFQLLHQAKMEAVREYVAFQERLKAMNANRR